MSEKGRVIEILKPESGTSKAGKEWNKQEFVIETDDQYPRKICFNLFGDKTGLISDIKVGDELEVEYNLESREYNGRWFHNVNCWKVGKVAQGETNQPTEPTPPPEPEDDGTDLPF